MAKLLGNIALLIAGGFLFLGAAIGVGVLLLYVFGLVLAKRLVNPARTRRLTASGR